MFSGSPRGAKASAILDSLIEAAKANKLEPGAYLKHLFETLPKAGSENAPINLLPQNIKMSDLDSQGSFCDWSDAYNYIRMNLARPSQGEESDTCNR